MARRKPFPLLKLAYLPLKKVLRNVKPAQLLFLANLSPEADAAVRSVSFKDLYKLECCFETQMTVRIANQQNEVIDQIVFRFEVKPGYMEPVILLDSETVMNGFRFRMIWAQHTREPIKICYLVRECDIFELAFTMYDYIQRIFDTDRIGVWVNTNDLPDATVRSIVEWSKPKRAENFFLGYDEVSADNIFNLLESPREIEILTIKFRSFYDDFKIPDCPIQVDTLLLAVEYLPVYELIKAVKCRTVQFEDHDTFSLSDFSSLMNAWLDGALPEFKTMWLDLGSRSRFDFNAALEEFRSRGKEWDRKERGQFYPKLKCIKPRRLDCRDGVDFRNKDGVLGTIVIEPTVFAFVVWHEPFPEHV